MRHTREFMALRNDPALAGQALAAAEAVFGANKVPVAEGPITASEGFARVPRHVPDNLAFLGNGGALAPSTPPASTSTPPSPRRRPAR